MADDIDIDFEKMSLWTADEATAYFESGGTEEPKPAPALPPAAAPMPKASPEEFKKWFPKAFAAGEPAFAQPPKFRLVSHVPTRHTARTIPRESVANP